MSKSNNKIIDKLTPEQEAKIPLYEKQFRDIQMNTEPTDKAKAEDAVRRSYVYLAKTQKDISTNPEFVWADSPMKGARLAAEILKGSKDITTEELRAQAEQAAYGTFEAYWTSVYAFIGFELPVETDELLQIVVDIVKNCGAYWTFNNLVVMTPKPSMIEVENNKLHCISGPALQYPNGDAIYAYKGERKNSLMEVIMAARADSGTDAEELK